MAINPKSIEQNSTLFRSDEVLLIDDSEASSKNKNEKSAGKARGQKKRTQREIIIRLIEYLVNTP